MFIRMTFIQHLLQLSKYEWIDNDFAKTSPLDVIHRYHRSETSCIFFLKPVMFFLSEQNLTLEMETEEWMTFFFLFTNVLFMCQVPAAKMERFRFLHYPHCENIKLEN